MPNINTLLKQEILRVSRRANSAELTAMRKSAAQHRRDIAALKRQLAALSRQVASVVRSTARAGASARSTQPTKVRFSAKGLRAQRKRLGLSAGDFARLVGSSAQSVYNWEQEKATPRLELVAAIAGLRGMGKREAAAKLAKLD